MLIEKVLKVENVGRFAQLLPKGDVQFRRLNLVYGPNGHGKTTLAGIVRSMGTGDPAYISERAKLGAGAPHVEIRAGGQNASFTQGKWSVTASDFEIFDSTFVSDNVYTGEHVDSEHRKNLYQVVVGAAAVALARRIDDIDTEGRALAREAAGHEEKLKEIIQAPFAVDDFLNLKPEEKVRERIGDLTTKLSAARKSKEVLARREPEPLQVQALPPKVLDVLRATVEQISKQAEERVRQHVAVRLDNRGEQWVRQGLEYLREDAACPFCAQSTEGVELVALFRKYFSAGYREHVIEIERAVNLVEQTLGDQVLHGIQKKALENEARIRVWADLVDLGYAKASLAAFESAARKLRTLLNDALKQKLANPSAVSPAAQQLEAALRDYVEGRQNLEALNRNIARAAEEVATVKKDAATAGEATLEQELRRLRNVQIREQPHVNELCSKLQQARVLKKKLEEEKKDKRKALENLAEQVLSKYEAAINDLLKNFGASFRIAGTKPSFPGGKASSTYKISIDNNPLELGDSNTPRGVPCFRTALSAGDKSTLALAFFVARLRSDKDLNKKTVIFDDPLSSLDDFRTSCTTNEICWIARNAAQAIVLSHDATFLKAVFDAHEKASMKVVEIAREAAGFVLREWDVVRYCRHETHRAYFNLRRYLDSGIPEGGDLRIIALDIRIYLEGSLRHLFPDQFPSDKWLGDFIETIRTAPAGSKLATWKHRLPDLEAVNDYSKKFHHAGPAGAPPPNDTELRTHVERAIGTMQGA